MGPANAHAGVPVCMHARTPVHACRCVYVHVHVHAHVHACMWLSGWSCIMEMMAGVGATGWPFWWVGRPGGAPLRPVCARTHACMHAGSRPTPSPHQEVPPQPARLGHVVDRDKLPHVQPHLRTHVRWALGPAMFMEDYYCRGLPGTIRKATGDYTEDFRGLCHDRAGPTKFQYARWHSDYTV
jgi:hypothetical protein